MDLAAHWMVDGDALYREAPVSVGRIIGSREVTLTRIVGVNIGHANCDCCGAESPPPAEFELEQSALAGRSCCWPFDHWYPEGWLKVTSITGVRYWCGECSRIAVTAMERKRS